jgi:Kef-type K+ transport system membrane component KefB
LPDFWDFDGYPSLVGGLLLARLLGYGWNASVLIGSVLASHTLLGYPLLAKMNLVKRESVLVTVGGTLITDIASMVILAVCISIHEVGFTWKFLVTELIELAVYVPLVIFGISKLASKAVIKFCQSAERRLSILIIVITVSSELAQFINLEGIVGAFLAGIAVKRSLKGKFALEHPEVISESLFMPAFF